MKKNKVIKISEYPFCESLGLVVSQPHAYIKRDDLIKTLKELKIEKVFNKYFGVQTCMAGGPFASDCEAVFVRIYKGLLTGTQNPILWD